MIQILQIKVLRRMVCLQWGICQPSITLAVFCASIAGKLSGKMQNSINLTIVDIKKQLCNFMQREREIKGTPMQPVDCKGYTDVN